MGIKVACPNGHRLDVKVELAGKRGICPKCKVSFKIEPAEGEQKGNATKPKPQKPAPQKKPTPPQPAPKQLPSGSKQQPAASKTKPPAQSKTPKPQTPASAGGKQRAAKSAAGPAKSTATSANKGTKQPATKQPATKSKPSAAPKPPALPSGNGAGPGQPAIKKMVAEPGDPIAEAPQLGWYVRHPNGSQYGPAKGELMRQWLAEGRIGGDSLTWREDWPEWKRADQVFAQFAAEVPVQPGTSTKQASATLPAGASAHATSAQDDSATEIRTRRGQAYRRKQQKLRLIISAVLLIVVIALGVTLALVLTR